MAEAQPAILITGAARRLGREIARYLAKHGHDIAIHYHNSENAAQSLAEEISALGRRTALIRADLTDTELLPGIIDEALSNLPHLRVLVNNASVFEPAPFKKAGEHSFDSNFAVNLKAPALLTHAFANAVNGEFSVINMIDSKIDFNKHSYFYYLLSKKGLADFTCMAAAELAPRGRVNAVCPGRVLPDVGESPESLAEKAAKLPLQKTPTPEEVCEAVYSLIHNHSITGQLLFVDGGGHLV